MTEKEIAKEIDSFYNERSERSFFWYNSCIRRK
jgi:hypothetical protein